MNAIITLKQLRTDPREYIRLLKSGYEVEITEHRKTIVKAVRSQSDKAGRAGDMQTLLRMIEAMPPLEIVDKNLDTVEAVRKARNEQLQKKYK